MLESFLILLREALQCSLLMLFLCAAPSMRGMFILAGAATAALFGAGTALVPALNPWAASLEAWITLRHMSEVLLLYAGMFLLYWHKRRAYVPVEGPSRLSAFVLGLVLFFFEARGGFFWAASHAAETGQSATASIAAATFGIWLGLGAFVFALPFAARLRFERFATLPGALVMAAILKFVTGGVGELEGSSAVAPLSRGMQYFVEHSVRLIQNALMLTDHEFIATPVAGLFKYLAGDRMSTAALVLFITAPPVAVLLDIFARPDPDVRAVRVRAQQRLRIAFFRREMMLMSAPLLISFFVIVGAIHAANSSLNPLSEPTPVPVRESEFIKDSILIPMSDRGGDIADGLLRKYLFYSGSDKIIFLAIMKPDGTLGLALDECEICKPADWNTAAKGYAQRGENLVCKYCMTPISVASVNKPGGCNPIPIEFRIENDNIVILVEELVRVFKETQALEKKGTHL